MPQTDDVSLPRLRALLDEIATMGQPEAFEGPAYEATLATGLVKTKRVADSVEDVYDLTVCGVFICRKPAWETTATANAITFALSRLLPALLAAVEERDRLRVERDTLRRSLDLMTGTVPALEGGSPVWELIEGGGAAGKDKP